LFTTIYRVSTTAIELGHDRGLSQVRFDQAHNFQQDKLFWNVGISAYFTDFPCHMTFRKWAY